MYLNQCHKTNSKSFLADPQLYVMGIILLVVTTIIGLFMVFWALDKYIEIFALYLILTLTSNITIICVLPKWRIIIELSEDGISYKPTFKKKIVKKYSDFGYFYCASYTYYTERKYIVFSQRRLNDYELTHINNVAVSDKLIKIKVRKGLKEELSPFLPPKFLFRIPKDFW